MKSLKAFVVVVATVLAGSAHGFDRCIALFADQSEMRVAQATLVRRLSRAPEFLPSLESAFQTSMLMTVVGVKPISMITKLDLNDSSSRFETLMDGIDALVDRGLFDRGNLGFIHSRGPNLGVESSGSSDSLIVYNRAAIEHRLRDREVLAVLERAGFTHLNSADRVISFLKERFGDRAGPVGLSAEEHLLLSTLLGIPPGNAARFAQGSRHGEGRIFSVSIEGVPGEGTFRPFRFTTFLPEDSPRLERMRSQGRRAVNWYLETRRSGLTPLQILLSPRLPTAAER